MLTTTNPDGSLSSQGYAIHMAYDLMNEGFDGTGYDPIDAALTLAALVVALTESE